MGLINKTALALMKPGAVLIPVSANPVDFDALYHAACFARFSFVSATLSSSIRCKGTVKYAECNGARKQ